MRISEPSHGRPCGCASSALKKWEKSAEIFPLPLTFSFSGLMYPVHLQKEVTDGFSMDHEMDGMGSLSEAACGQPPKALPSRTFVRRGKPCRVFLQEHRTR